MSILVTGAAGFIGSNVVRMLVEEGAEVVGYDVARPGSHRVNAKMLDKISFVSGSVADLPLLLNTINKHKVEGIIHTAAIMGKEADDSPLQCVQANIEGTINVLEAVRILKLRRAVCCSSSSVAGDQEGRSLSSSLKETDFDLPYNSMYAVSKLANEGHIHLYRKLFGVDAIACRPARVWGPGLIQLRHSIGRMVTDAVAGKPIKMANGGDTKIDYTFVKDHARGLIQAFHVKPTKNYVFNMSGGRLVSVFEIADVLRGIFPKLPIEVGPGEIGAVVADGYKSAVRPAFDITRAKEELGYNPQYGIEKGIPAWVAWLKEEKYI